MPTNLPSAAEGWSRAGLAGGYAAGRAKPLGVTASDQAAGALLAGGMEQLLAAYVNARARAAAPVVVRRAEPVDQVTLSPGARDRFVQAIAATATGTIAAAKVAATATRPSGGTPPAMAELTARADDYRAIGRAAQARGEGRWSASALERGRPTSASPDGPVWAAQAPAPKNPPASGAGAAAAPAAPAAAPPSSPAPASNPPPSEAPAAPPPAAGGGQPASSPATGDAATPPPSPPASPPAPDEGTSSTGTAQPPSPPATHEGGGTSAPSPSSSTGASSGGASTGASSTTSTGASAGTTGASGGAGTSTGSAATGTSGTGSSSTSSGTASTGGTGGSSGSTGTGGTTSGSSSSGLLGLLFGRR